MVADLFSGSLAFQASIALAECFTLFGYHLVRLSPFGQALGVWLRNAFRLYTAYRQIVRTDKTRSIFTLVKWTRSDICKLPLPYRRLLAMDRQFLLTQVPSASGRPSKNHAICLR